MNINTTENIKIRDRFKQNFRKYSCNDCRPLRALYHFWKSLKILYMLHRFSRFSSIIEANFVSMQYGV